MEGMRIEIPGGRSPEGEALRNFRVQAGLTQKQLGEISGMSTGALGMIESGHYRPSVRAIRVISAALPLLLSEEQAVLALRAQPWNRRTSITEAREGSLLNA
jgi:transcriptional regulator with XRE-family HTH domain